MQAPCKECPDRYVGCHERCEKYLAFAAEREEIRRKRYQEYVANDNSPAKETAFRIVGSLIQRGRYGK